jgi:hypothetical protein
MSDSASSSKAEPYDRSQPQSTTRGTRLRLNELWSLVIEGAYRHISNAEIKKPNFGIDSVGGNVGFGFSF